MGIRPGRAQRSAATGQHRLTRWPGSYRSEKFWTLSPRLRAWIGAARIRPSNSRPVRHEPAWDRAAPDAARGINQMRRLRASPRAVPVQLLSRNFSSSSSRGDDDQCHRKRLSASPPRSERNRQLQSSISSAPNTWDDDPCVWTGGRSLAGSAATSIVAEVNAFARKQKTHTEIQAPQAGPRPLTARQRNMRPRKRRSSEGRTSSPRNASDAKAESNSELCFIPQPAPAYHTPHPEKAGARHPR